MAAYKDGSGERGSCRSIIMTGLERIVGRSRGALKQGVRRWIGSSIF